MIETEVVQAHTGFTELPRHLELLTTQHGWPDGSTVLRELESFFWNRIRCMNAVAVRVLRTPWSLRPPIFRQESARHQKQLRPSKFDQGSHVRCRSPTCTLQRMYQKCVAVSPTSLPSKRCTTLRILARPDENDGRARGGIIDQISSGYIANGSRREGKDFSSRRSRVFDVQLPSTVQPVPKLPRTPYSIHKDIPQVMHFGLDSSWWVAMLEGLSGLGCPHLAALSADSPVDHQSTISSNEIDELRQ
ncbi:hypothetical protein NA56DRAFT_641386 [Hyaloscypha hepaticicola]|uniref:Uncharacterized protein n=1 Tax=Hyaloscypha hepaticicola TaxID=2082293 RepID=A0A2J6QKA7_9HELO|nr:hypothetical protein NA56DRAFT_641386 [Hyaloscypha hepaticicola]